MRTRILDVLDGSRDRALRERDTSILFNVLRVEEDAQKQVTMMSSEVVESNRGSIFE